MRSAVNKRPRLNFALGIRPAPVKNLAHTGTEDKNDHRQRRAFAEWALEQLEWTPVSNSRAAPGRPPEQTPAHCC